MSEWNLNDIYTSFDSAEFSADFEEISSIAKKMDSLSENIANFENAKDLIRLLEDYCEKNDRISSYAHYIYATDTSNPDASKYIFLLDSIDAETSRMKVRLAEFLSKNELKNEHGLDHYAFQLRHMAEEFSHMMSEDEETLAAMMSNTGAGSWALLQDKLISNLTCEYTDPKTNLTKTIGINECRNLAYDADSKVREAAYKAELAAYPKIEESCAAAINSIKGEVNLLCTLRKFEHPLERTLFDSSMTKTTLDAMFQAIDADLQFFRDYLKAKARSLKKEKLAFFDMFAPVGKSAKNFSFSYEEAKNFVAENFGKFSHGMEKVARQAFDNEWIDVFPREGKVSGAFCGDVYAIKQFRILLNFGGNLADVITLAHELGHGYHSMQVMREDILNTHYPMPLAETASTFCEMIVTNAALTTLPDEQKLQLLENSLQDATQVILDIYSRFLFEKSVFETRKDHPLSVQELNGLMLAAQRAAYGDGLDENILHPYMWAIKPHYYSANMSFYNFPYAFGHLLANGLYKIYDADPSSFGKKYDEFLRVSGKMPIKESCEILGINVEDSAFWRSALDVIKITIKKFEELI